MNDNNVFDIRKINAVIIGGLGVGKAHAIAVEQLGGTISAIIDIQKSLKTCAEQYSERHWVNKWETITDEVIAKSKPLILGAETIIKNMIMSLDTNLVIITSPDYTHNEYTKSCLRLFPNAKIICEKPCLLDWDTSVDKVLINNERVFGGYEWLYHKELIEYIKTTEIETISMFHDNIVDGRNIIGDLVSHLYSIIFNKYIGYSLFKVIPNKVTNRRAEFTIIIEDIWKNHKYISVCAYYDPYNLGIREIYGFPVIGKTDPYDVEILINGKPFGWKDYLFTEQIIHVMNNKGYIGFIERIDKALAYTYKSIIISKEN